MSKLLNDVRNKLRVHHYALKTEKTYVKQSGQRHTQGDDSGGATLDSARPTACQGARDQGNSCHRPHDDCPGWQIEQGRNNDSGQERKRAKPVTGHQPYISFQAPRGQRRQYQAGEYQVHPHDLYRGRNGKGKRDVKTSPADPFAAGKPHRQ
jgi:hypothetical protein